MYMHVCIDVLHDQRIEQHATLISAEKAERGTMKITKRALYEELDEELQILIAHFDVYPRQEYFKRARALFNF